MFVHSVYFTLKDDLSDADRRRFEEGLASLADIETVRQRHIGTPADTHRPIIDRDYTHALVLAFDDAAGHDAYQDHPVHDAFRDTCSHCWAQVRIFDVQTPPE
ncbi:MAG: Dabb family protein [Rhodothermales bacterium]